jgi:hypothetical protein
MEILTRSMRVNRLAFVFLPICLLVTFNSISQKKHKLKAVKGEWVISNDITMPQAKEKAIVEAKLEALRQAGVPELISESSLSYVSEGENGMKDIFESITKSDMFGEISDFEIVKEEKKINDVGNIIYNVWIDATVIIHKELKDPGFGCDVKGIKSSYFSPDALSFSIQPWKDCYLRIFIVSENEGTQLYPSKFEPQAILNAEKQVEFPRKGFQYEISTEKKAEINYLILLLTKQDIPFKEKETPQNILRFISNINPSQKTLKTFSLFIKKE